MRRAPGQLVHRAVQRDPAAACSSGSGTACAGGARASSRSSPHGDGLRRAPHRRPARQRNSGSAGAAGGRTEARAAQRAQRRQHREHPGQHRDSTSQATARAGRPHCAALSQPVWLWEFCPAPERVSLATQEATGRANRGGVPGESPARQALRSFRGPTGRQPSTQAMR